MVYSYVSLNQRANIIQYHTYTYVYICVCDVWIVFECVSGKMSFYTMPDVGIPAKSISGRRTTTLLRYLCKPCIGRGNPAQIALLEAGDLRYFGHIQNTLCIFYINLSIYLFIYLPNHLSNLSNLSSISNLSNLSNLSNRSNLSNLSNLFNQSIYLYIYIYNLIKSYLILNYHIISYLILTYLVLSYMILSYLI